MRNMSTQFYKEIAKILHDFFDSSNIKKGDRYYLQLDSTEEVEQLINVLQENEGTRIFKYKHELGEEYRTFAIPYNSILLVVAHTSDNVKPDFLVTLRNLVGEQEGEWENTALLSIVSGQLDSIQGGSSDLQKEGMPLHPVSVYSNLKNEIQDSSLGLVDKIILLDNLEHLMDDYVLHQITFLDFEDIITILHKGKIGDKEYQKFGLFKDPDLATFKGKDQQERLKSNREFFEFVKKVHEFGLEQEELEKMFSPEGARELIKTDWEDIPYSTILKYRREYLELNKEKKVKYSELTVKNKLEFWDKPASESAAGKRKRHIIIFNPEKQNEIELKFSFEISGNDKSLSSKFLRIDKASKSNLNVEVKQTNIIVNINYSPSEPVFTKFSYKHDGKASLGAEFLIAVLPIEPQYIDAYKSTYVVNHLKNYIEIHFDNDHLIFGSGLEQKEVEIERENQCVTLTKDETLKIVPLPEAFNESDELEIKIQFEKEVVPFLLRNELPESTPINGQRIWKLIRETGKDMEWVKENNRLILENREFYFHSEYRDFFKWEAEWIDKGFKSAKLESDRLHSIDINLSDSLREAYSRLLTYYKTRSQLNNCIPSLCSINEELRSRSIEYLNEFRKEIELFEEGVPAGKKGRDLFKLGTIYANGMIYFTPFHPIMVAFKLKIYELLQKEEVDNSILNRLRPEALVPFLYDEDETLYKPDHQRAAMDWLVFKPVHKVSVSDASHYLAKVVRDKIAQFKEHFSYLFIKNSHAPLQINVINISNDMEVVRGILQWMINEIKIVGIEHLIPIEITLYNNNDGNGSAFDLYARTDDVKQFEELFEVKLKAKNLEADDVLRAIRSKLFFYKQDIGNEIRYGHITFYKMHAQDHHAVQPINKMKTGIAIEGIYSSIPSMKDEENYKSGFGIKCYSIDHEKDYLVSTTYYVNELAANLRNYGNDSYRKGEAIFSRTTTTDEETLMRIFASSHWVTFVDPPVDLEYFQNFDEDIVIIHYSDQYSSSSRYDAITVTDKFQQYYAVIEEFLKQKEVEGNRENVINTIKAFNTFNGEWLLRIIGSKGHYDREKLSIISAIKFSVSYFDHPNILWIPISLEEILRVAGAVSLDKSDGVFTAKNLGVKGNHSDDLLLIGLEILGERIKVHFYPIEVKIGYNKSDIIEKAKKQVKQTKELFMTNLTGEAGNTFAGRFYRNFFVQLLIANSQKLSQSDFWKDKEYELKDEILEKLLKDDYQISNELSSYIGEGAVLSFQKELFHRSAYLDEEVLIINLTESDGYEGLVVPIKKLRDWIQEKPNDFIAENLLSRRYNPYKIENHNEFVTGVKKEVYTTLNQGSPSIISNSNEDLDEQDHTTAKDEEIIRDGIDKKDESIVAITNLPTNISGDIGKETETKGEKVNKVPLSEVRFLIGTVEGSNHKIYWEYGNKDLANRHLLISGKSGQGKTYFMQCLIVEQSKLGIPTIVVDYTEGFLPNQLEPEFVEFLGSKLKQKIVYNEKLPINPFMRNVRDIGGIQLPESNTDIAERVKSVFSAVYKSLGIQQQNAIYEAVLHGLEQYGEKMNLTILRDLLNEDGSNYAKTALSQIRPLIDRNPFSIENTIDWEEIITSDGEVYIIQLTGFPRDVQLIITEFILWDLWNYSIRLGNKNKPIPIILDEAQNLDHSEKSPSARILQEGRKFGWSAWYATQFLKAQLAADELARLQMASQKVYFSPPEQELSNIASSLTKEADERKVWEKKLSLLKKGQCVVHGPIKNKSGELTQPTAMVVNISPLSLRI